MNRLELIDREIVRERESEREREVKIKMYKKDIKEEDKEYQS